MEITIAEESDVKQIMNLFIKIYGKNYPLRKFYGFLTPTSNLKLT